MMDIVNDVDALAHSPNARRVWRPTAFNPNGSAKAWGSEGVVIVQTTQRHMLAFRVQFRNGKQFHAATLAEAEEYAERHDTANR